MSGEKRSNFIIEAIKSGDIAEIKKIIKNKAGKFNKEELWLLIFNEKRELNDYFSYLLQGEKPDRLLAFSLLKKLIDLGDLDEICSLIRNNYLKLFNQGELEKLFLDSTVIYRIINGFEFNRQRELEFMVETLRIIKEMVSNFDEILSEAYLKKEGNKDLINLFITSISKHPEISLDKWHYEDNNTFLLEIVKGFRDKSILYTLIENLTQHLSGYKDLFTILENMDLAPSIRLIETLGKTLIYLRSVHERDYNIEFDIYIEKIKTHLYSFYRMVINGYYSTDFNTLIDKITDFLEILWSYLFFVPFQLDGYIGEHVGKYGGTYNDYFHYCADFFLNHDIGIKIQHDVLVIELNLLFAAAEEDLEIINELNKREIIFKLNQNKIFEDNAHEQDWLKKYIKKYHSKKIYREYLKKIDEWKNQKEYSDDNGADIIINYKGAKILRVEARALEEFETLSREKLEFIENFEEEISDHDFYKNTYENNQKIKTIKEFKVNEYITLKLENGKTNIYVGGELFNQCKYVLMRKTVYELEDLLENIESIDELSEHLDHSLGDLEPELIDIPSETRFWVHCSNMQVWAENNYDTRLLHSNLAFPLLKKLTQIGDLLAKRVFKDEIAKRFKSCHPSVFELFIREDYLEYLNAEEIDTLFQDLDFDLIFKQTSSYLIFLYGQIERNGALGAKKIINKEIVKRINRGNLSEINLLIAIQYIDHLEREELETIYLDANPKLREALTTSLKDKSTLEKYSIPILKKFIELGDPSVIKFIKKKYTESVKGRDFSLSLRIIYNLNFKGSRIFYLDNNPALNDYISKINKNKEKFFKYLKESYEYDKRSYLSNIIKIPPLKEEIMERYLIFQIILTLAGKGDTNAKQTYESLRQKILLDPIRKKIYEFIENNPGMYHSNIIKILTERYGKSAVEAEGIIYLLKRFNFIKNYPNIRGPGIIPYDIPNRISKLYYLLRDDLNRNIIKLLLDTPRIEFLELKKKLNEPERKIRFKIYDLKKADLLLTIRDETNKEREDFFIEIKPENSEKCARIISKFF